MVTLEKGRKAQQSGKLWLEKEWMALRDIPVSKSTPEREELFSSRLVTWADYDARLWLMGSYNGCVMSAEPNATCPREEPLCCSGCVRKRAKKLRRGYQMTVWSA